MLVYLVRRVALAVFLVWTVSFVAFCAFGLSFDPLYQLNICGDSCKAERDALAAQYHIHDPILERYWYWLSGLVHHGFGSSVFGHFGETGTPIGPQLWRSAAVTGQLMATSLVLTVLFGVAIGVVSAKRRGSLADGVL
ncbi:MAG: hypothetical protein ACRDLK_12785, partial [Gaiellaceae bacterium]